MRWLVYTLCVIIYINTFLSWDSTQWSPCSAACGGGDRFRTTKCVFKVHEQFLDIVILFILCVIWPYVMTQQLTGIVVFIPLIILRLFITRVNGQIEFSRDMPNWACLSQGLPPNTIDRCNEKKCLTPLDLYGKFIGNAGSLPNPGDKYMDVAAGLKWSQLDCANMCNQRASCRAYGFLPKVGACHLFTREWNYYLDVPELDRLLFSDYLIGYKNKAMEEEGAVAPANGWNDVSADGVVEVANSDQGKLVQFIFPTFEVPGEFYCKKMTNELKLAHGYQYDTDHKTCQIFSREVYENMETRGDKYQNIRVMTRGPALPEPPGPLKI